MRRAPEQTIRVRPLAGGTRARHDGIGGRWWNESTGQGGPLDRHTETTFVPPMPLDRGTIDALYQFNAVARRIVDREPEDATREGFEIAELEGNKAVADALDDAGLLTAVGRARKWARAQGGAAIIPLVDDGARTAAEPLRMQTVIRVRGFRVVDRHEIWPETYCDDPGSPRVGLPEVYRVQFGSQASIRVHGSRVVPFQGLDLPDRVLAQRNGWGGSLLDLVWAEVRNWCSSNDYVAELVTQLTQGVFKQKDLSAAVAAMAEQDGDEGTRAIVARFEAMKIGMGILGDIVLDAEGEEYELQQRTLAGLKDAMDALVTALVAATGIPRVILLGETPGGLHAGSDAPEIRAWYDHVATLQRELYSRPVRALVRLVLSAREGPTSGRVPTSITINWRPLWQPSEAEQLAADLQRAQRRATDVSSAVVTAAEARRDPDLEKHYGQLQGGSPTTGDLPGDEIEGEVGTATLAMPGVTAAPVSSIPAGESLMSAQEAAARLGVGAGAIHGMARRGTIQAWRVGSRWRYAWSQIAAATEPPAAAG